ncbi:MAG: Gfo/Idh/MocA family protein [Limisphaerales bacterium]
MPALNSSRRGFLRSVATLAAAPLVLPGHVWAESPADKITLGFIGLGTQGRGLMNGFLNRDDVQVVAVCDCDRTRRDNGRKIVEDFYAKKTGAGGARCLAFTDFRDVLARPDVDAVVIATPDHWHAVIGVAAAEAKKDIYCEKPLTQSIAEARALVRAVRRNSRVFQTGSQQRSSPEFLKACELVRNGAIGRIQEVHVAIGGPGVWCDLPAEEPEPGLDWNLWLGPAPFRAYHSELSPRGVHRHFPNWRRYREYGGGMVTDWGAHHFDICQWGLGMDESGPVEVIPADKPGAQSGVTLIYPNGALVRHVEGNGVTFIGSDGRIFVNRGKFEPDRADLASYVPGTLKEKLHVSTDHKGDWLDCVRRRRRPICDVEIGARSVTVCHLVNLAYWHGQPMRWDPKENTFAGGTGNPMWLDVSRRGPWGIG